MKKVIIGKIIATLLLVILAVSVCMLICSIDDTFFGNLEKLSICLMLCVFPASGILLTWACGM